MSLEKCFEVLSEEEHDQFLLLQSKFNQDFDLEEYERLVNILIQASRTISTDIRKENLVVKSDALVVFLDKEEPQWRDYMNNTLKNNISNILKLFLCKYHLDLSVFYLIDNTIHHLEITTAYHDFISTHFLKSYTGVRVYHLYYNKKCLPIQDPKDESPGTHRGSDMDRKKRLGELENELKRMRSFSDFLRSGKRMRIFQASSLHNMFIFSDDELRICVPPIDSMMRGLGGVINIDYRVNVFLASYLGTLAAFIPTFQDFELAKKEGMFETNMRYCDFKLLCSHFYVQVDDYDEYLYMFVVHANKYFYQYLNAFWRDLTNKLMFEPVTFYLTFMATIFSLCSLIQVLQNAKIIPPISS